MSNYNSLNVQGVVDVIMEDNSQVEVYFTQKYVIEETKNVDVYVIEKNSQVDVSVLGNIVP